MTKISRFLTTLFNLLRQTDIFWRNFSKHEFLRSVGAQALRGVPLIIH